MDSNLEDIINSLKVIRAGIQDLQDENENWKTSAHNNHVVMVKMGIEITRLTKELEDARKTILELEAKISKMEDAFGEETV